MTAPDARITAWIELALRPVPAQGLAALLRAFGTPEAILDKLHAAFAQTMKDPGVQAKLLEQGFDIRTGGRAEFGAYIRSETAKWTKIVKAAGVTAEE